MAYIVTAPLVVTNKPDGSHLYLYENALVPANVKPDAVKRLLDLGMIAEVADKAPVKAPAAQSN